MRLLETTLPNGMKVVITDKSDPRNVQMFQKIFDSLKKGE